MEEVSVILVDGHDNQIELMQKTETHKRGLLHRAISVFICNSKGEWLLQQRSLNKYHSSNLWTNTYYSHPLPKETNLETANRRLFEEMDIKCKMNELFSFQYREVLDNGLIEHEFDHVFFGITNDYPIINLQEVHEFKYMEYSDLKKDVNLNPNNYTIWFKRIFERVNQLIKKDCFNLKISLWSTI